MNEDMSDIINKLSSMINSNEFPDDLKNMLNNFSANTNTDKSDISSTIENTSTNIDINTILKMKTIIDNMNNQKDDPRSNLLNSLKPYLRNSRREKIDQYIKIFSMSKAFEVFNHLGGDKKNNV